MILALSRTTYNKVQAFDPHHNNERRTTIEETSKEVDSLYGRSKEEFDNYSDCEKLSMAFLLELNTFEIPLLKSKAVMDAHVREKENFNELKYEINRQTLKAQGDIEDLQKLLKESKIEGQHKEECGSIRKLIAGQTPRSETQKIIIELEKEISMLEVENTAGSRTLDLRKKQFTILLHMVDELRNTFGEEQ